MVRLQTAKGRKELIRKTVFHPLKGPKGQKIEGGSGCIQTAGGGVWRGGVSMLLLVKGLRKTSK